jgi:CheY-like chemotaxis protein
VSGRGIGMDVVNQRIATLRGTLTITTETGRGTRVQMRLPVTQTLANVIVARGQRQVSAVVAASVERVISFAAGECRYDDGQLRVTLGDEVLSAFPIEAFYGESADLSMWVGSTGIGLYVRDADGKGNVILVRSIDEVRSVVVKPISAYLPPIPAVRGITQLGDGGLAPVIDLDVLLQSAQTQRFDTAVLSHATAAVTRVVVADDSLSVRRALEQLMQDAGFEVATARDGFEALAAIQAKPTHAVLIDLEMPRMNGLEVARNLRNHAETRDLPVVMITSRTTDKHQAMAAEAGVTRMLGKPFSEDALVALVRELIAERGAVTSD